MGTWSEESIGDLSGKRAIVTGANSGVGYYTAKVLGVPQDGQRGEREGLRDGGGGLR